MSDPLRLIRTGAVGHLVLDRPEKRNALTEAMWLALPELIRRAEADETLRLLIVRGEGGAFASGADIGEFEDVYATPERASAYSAAISAGLDAVAGFSRPSLAVIEGACVGGGCALALACDLRFAARGARFGVTPGKIGLAYPHNDMKRLIDAVGPAAAKDLIYTARHVQAEEALAMGLIDRLEETDGLAACVEDFAAQVCANSPRSARANKAIIAAIEAGEAEETEVTRQLFLDTFKSRDFQIGYRAFLAKTKPDFSGAES